MEGLAFTLRHCIKLDMNISFPFSRHEGILEVLKEIGKGKSLSLS